VTYIDVSAQTQPVEGLPAPQPFRFLRRLLKRPVAVAALCVIITVYTVGILAPLIAPHGFMETDLRNRYADPSWEHPLGTDELGHDMLSRVIWASQTTVIISVAVLVTGGLILGVTLGLLAGYLGGRADFAIMRLGDLLNAVPTILLLLIFNSTMKDRVENVFKEIEDFFGVDGLVSSGVPNYFLLAFALSIFGWVGLARLIRSQVLALREMSFVTASEAAGASTFRIVVRHLLPNVSNLIIVSVTISLGAVAAAEVGLTFLGLGVTTRSFGVMIADYAGAVRVHPELVLYPGIIVAALILAFNLLGDALTDVLSPRRR
jgi:ABC-type dipeptide/oligopeptide/nickel transport system permease subunit